MTEAIYERWDNGEKVEVIKPKELKVRRLTKDELEELKELITRWAEDRMSDRT